MVSTDLAEVTGLLGTVPPEEQAPTSCSFGRLRQVGSRSAAGDQG